MIDIQVDTTGISKLKLTVARIKNQMPFATSVALNQTARDVQQAYRAEVPRSFTNPVAYTRNAFRYDKSTKANLVATVYPDKSRKYFPTEIFGGTRRTKPYEGFIRGLAGNALPRQKLVPTRIVLNAAGNPKKSIFSQISNRLSTTDRGGFFIGTPKGGNRGPGVYRRSRGQLHAYFVTVDEPSYEPRFPLGELGNRVAGQVFTTHLSKALDRAISSAR